MKQLDLEELQQEVINKWDDQGVVYTYSECVTDDPYCIYQHYIKEEYQDILDDVMSCLAQLGFDKISDYLASKRDE